MLCAQILRPHEHCCMCGTTTTYANDILVWRKLELRSCKIAGVNVTRKSGHFRTTIAMMACRGCYQNRIKPFKFKKRRQCDVEGCKRWARRRFEEFELSTDCGALLPSPAMQPFICNECYDDAESFQCPTCADSSEDSD